MKYVIILFLIIVAGCSNVGSKYVGSVRIDKCHNLYIERFVSRFGTYSFYLTDSTNFRIYAGDYDDERGMISYDCNGDSVYIYKKSREDLVDYIVSPDTLIAKKKLGVTSSSWDTLKTIKITRLSLNKLKKLNNL